MWNAFGRSTGAEQSNTSGPPLRDIYLKAYADGWQLEAGLQAYFEFYNCRRFHQGLAYQTPEEVLKGRKAT